MPGERRRPCAESYRAGGARPLRPCRARNHAIMGNPSGLPRIQAKDGDDALEGGGATVAEGSSVFGDPKTMVAEDGDRTLGIESRSKSLDAHRDFSLGDAAEVLE